MKTVNHVQIFATMLFFGNAFARADDFITCVRDDKASAQRSAEEGQTVSDLVKFQIVAKPESVRGTMETALGTRKLGEDTDGDGVTADSRNVVERFERGAGGRLALDVSEHGHDHYTYALKIDGALGRAEVSEQAIYDCVDEPELSVAVYTCRFDKVD